MHKNKGLNKIIISLILLLSLSACNQHQKNDSNIQHKIIMKENVKMTLTSPSFLNHQFIPSKYTCDGEDINPPLEINNIPKGARSLVLIVDDPDAPNGDWVHWLIWNIKADSRKIAENSIPEGAVQGVTSFGYRHWGGPCPPSGMHHYHFKLYALDNFLDLGGQNDKTKLIQAMQGHVLDNGQLIGLYKRNK